MRAGNRRTRATARRARSARSRRRYRDTRSASPPRTASRPAASATSRRRSAPQLAPEAQRRGPRRRLSTDRTPTPRSSRGRRRAARRRARWRSSRAPRPPAPACRPRPRRAAAASRPASPRRRTPASPQPAGAAATAPLSQSRKASAGATRSVAASARPPGRAMLSVPCFLVIVCRRYTSPRESVMNPTTDKAAMTISVVVPVYRSEPTLRELHRRIVGALAPRGAAFEIILVEDCGGDGSWRVIEELARARRAGQGHPPDPQLRPAQRPAVRHPRRAPRGRRHAGRRPAEPARGDRRGCSPALDEGYDVVYGTPQREQHGFLRGLASADHQDRADAARWAATRRAT